MFTLNRENFGSGRYFLISSRILEHLMMLGR